MTSNSRIEFRHSLDESLQGIVMRALQRNRESLVNEIDQIVSDMKEAHGQGRIRDYLALDTAFHAAFFRHCGNHYLKDSYDRYVGKIAALRTHLSTKPMHTTLSLQEHEAFRDLFRSGNDAQIPAVLEAHIGRTRDTYAASVEDIAAADALKSTG